MLIDKSKLSYQIFEHVPGFAPVVSKPGDAGADLKANISCSDHIDDLKPWFDAAYHGVHKININGSSNLGVDSFEDFTQTQLYSNLLVIPLKILLPASTYVFDCGFSIILPDLRDFGYVANYEIRPRSGLGAMHGVCVRNSPATIDAGYRGIIKVALENRGSGVHIFTHGARIAQGIYNVVVDQSSIQGNLIDKETFESLCNTERGDTGFGSSGV